MKIEKKELSGIEIYYLIKELKKLENSKVDRIYHDKSEKKELVIAVHQTGIGKSFLKIVLPSMIFIDTEKNDYETPTGFCMMLRKTLEGSIISSITQKDLERTIEITFEKKTAGKIEKYFLIIELFSKGNIIFCDSKYTILNILEEQHWTDRELKRTGTYIFPKSKNNILKSGEEQFMDIIKKSDRDSIVKSLAIDISLGGLYAEEICFLAGIDKKTKIKDLDNKKIILIYKIFQTLLKKEIKANGTKEYVLPFELEILKSEDKKYYESFNEAIVKNKSVKIDKTKQIKEKEIEKLRIIIKEQEKTLNSAISGYDENQKIAETIYEKYQEIDEIIKSIKKAREKYSWKEIKERISKDAKYKNIIKDINEKNSEITIILEDK